MPRCTDWPAVHRTACVSAASHAFLVDQLEPAAVWGAIRQPSGLEINHLAGQKTQLPTFDTRPFSPTSRSPMSHCTPTKLPMGAATVAATGVPAAPLRLGTNTLGAARLEAGVVPCFSAVAGSIWSLETVELRSKCPPLRIPCPWTLAAGNTGHQRHNRAWKYRHGISFWKGRRRGGQSDSRLHWYTNKPCKRLAVAALGPRFAQQASRQRAVQALRCAAGSDNAVPTAQNNFHT